MINTKSFVNSIVEMTWFKVHNWAMMHTNYSRDQHNKYVIQSHRECMLAIDLFLRKVGLVYSKPNMRNKKFHNKRGKK